MRISLLARSLSIVLLVATLVAAPPARASAVLPPATLSGGFIGNPIVETAASWNGNGLTDAVNLTVPVTLNTTAHWRLYGYLGANGTSIYNASEFYLGPGTYAFTLSFAGWIWRLSRWNGSFTGPLYLLDLDGSDSFKRNYTTASYRWTQMELRAELAGGYSSTPIDANADGSYDYLEITGTLHAGVPGQYNVTAYLYQSSGTALITTGLNRSVYTAGYTAYHMWLDGNAIRGAGIDGPYRVDVWLCLSPDCLFPSQADTFTTPAYTAASFEHNPIAISGNVTDSGVDTSGNGRYDYLRLTIPVNVSVPGIYNVTANLYGQFGFVENGATSAYLPAGNETVSLDFGGWMFRTNLLNGPFTVQLYVRENISTYQVSTTHATAAYIWSQFDSPYGLFGPMWVVPVDTDGNGKYNTLYVNTTIDAKISTAFQVQFTVMSLCCGNPIPDQSVSLTGGPGAIPVSFSVPGWTMNALGINDTFVFDLTLRIASPSAFDDIAGLAMNFTWDQFEPAIALRGAVTFHPVDADGDGHWNYVAVMFPLQVLVGGSYHFSLHAFNASCPTCDLTIPRSRHLDPGPFDLNVSISGVSLRQFPGDATLALAWSANSATALLWSGTYPIPDPTVFETLPTDQVTFHLQVPQPPICCAAVLLVNYTNAYIQRVTGSGVDPSAVAATVPAQSYVVYAVTITGTLDAYANVTGVAAPLPSDVYIHLALVGRYAQAAQVSFADWSSASLVRTRAAQSNPGFRFTADLNNQPDGVVTNAEIVNEFAVEFPPTSETTLSLDAVSLPLSPAAPDSVLGAGPVVGGPDLSYVENFSTTASPSSGLVHVVGLTESQPYLDMNTSARVLVPEGWVVSHVLAPAGSRVSGIGTPDVLVELPLLFSGTAFINLTATWSSSPYLPSVVSGTIVGTGNAVVPGALASLWQGATQVNATATDGLGHFLFGSLAAGMITLRVRATGFNAYERNIAVPTDAALDLGTVPLTAVPTTGGLRGRVADTAGNGIASATLVLTADVQTIATVRSNATGDFLFSSVPAGSYRLLVSAAGFATANVSVTVTAAQAADVGTIVLQALPPPAPDLSWLAWGSVVAVVVVAALTGWAVLRNRRKLPPTGAKTEPALADERTLK